MDANSFIIAYKGKEIESALKSTYYKGSYLLIDSYGPFYVSEMRTTLLTAAFKLEKNPLFEAEIGSEYEYDLSLVDSKTGQITGPDATGEYRITGLEPDHKYELLLNYHNADNSDQGSTTIKFTTQKVEFKCSYESTQTTVTINELSAAGTGDEKPTRVGVTTKDGMTTEYDFTGKPIKIPNLRPKSSNNLILYAYYGDVCAYGWDGELRTKALNPRIEAEEVGPTSIKLIGKYDEGDAKIVNIWFESDSKETIEETDLTVCGLDPNTKIGYRFYVQTDQGYSEWTDRTITTASELELTTLKPRCVSQSCAIVAAETNISDEEPNVGFEWKKYDAPASLAPNEGYAAIYDGRLEGYIKNLQPTSYYNVRAFYKSNAERYYYSDWVTFDPSDFSYFEPTVHTYPANYITGNSASVKGYALAGTDAIDEQGFEYWAEGGNRMRVLSETAAPEGVNTVFATGQVMRATFTGLRPATAYTFRAFVTTASGTTYGEEQTFTTAEDSGVEDVSADATEPEITGYYDITGRRHDEPLRGLNIVLYSDGSTRKVIMR